MGEHEFKWKGQTVLLVYSIDDSSADRRFILDDVAAGSEETANGVPDWCIEYECDAVAAEFGATYA